MVHSNSAEAVPIAASVSSANHTYKKHASGTAEQSCLMSCSCYLFTPRCCSHWLCLLLLHSKGFACSSLSFGDFYPMDITNSNWFAASVKVTAHSCKAITQKY